MNLKKISAISTIILLLVTLSACSKKQANDIISLTDKWYWTSDITDDTSFTKIENKKELYHLDRKLQERQGVIFLVADFYVPEFMHSYDLTFYLGRARIADRVYLNGEFIGKGGMFPPELFTAGYGTRSYSISDRLLNYAGKNRLIVELYVNEQGGLYSDSFIGSSFSVLQIQGHENFYHSRINEVFSFFMILIFIFYLCQYFARPEQKEHLYYALLNFFTAFFLLPFFVSEIPAINPKIIDFRMFSQLFIVVAAIITSFFATTYIRCFIKQPNTENVIICRIALVIMPIIVLFQLNDYSTFIRAVPFFFLFVGIQIMFAVWPLLVGLFNGNPLCRSLITSFLPVIITVFLDFYVHILRQNSSLPFFTIFGWQATLVTNLTLLSYRLNRLHIKIEELNDSLEKEVQKRTRELIKSNQALELQIQRNKQDMEYALNVQKNFFPKELPVFDEWELGYHLQPTSGVSGDFFDFFMNRGKLRGLALFDVSGHGLGAGLVTMLCKSIIEDKFNTTNPLQIVLMNMHYSIIAQKGDIENYLAGFLLRLRDDGTGELAGAGYQPPVLVHRSIQESELISPPAGTAQYGVIGMSDMAVSFAVAPFKMLPGDAMLLYTDGITEASDPHGIQYGRDMVEKVFSNLVYSQSDASAQQLADAVIQSLKRFTLSDTFDDDVTILVLKRK